MTNPELFEKQDYVFVEGGVDRKICDTVTNYALLQEKTAFNQENGGAQVPGAHSVYGDLLMESLSESVILPIMEQETGLELFPTYTYYRVYRKGQDLKRHMDRPACEISTTICFGFKYNGVDEDYNWGMFVDPLTTKIPMEERENKEETQPGYSSPMNPGIMYAQQPGDMIIYRGQQVEHWREKFNVQFGSWQVQAFFHFIDKNGPNYPEWKYDQRQGMGYKKMHNMGY